jgi:hypothetical protein
MPRPLSTPGKDPVPIVQDAGWAPEPVWTGAENLSPTGIRSPDRPARSQSLYRLSYPAHCHFIQRIENNQPNALNLIFLFIPYDGTYTFRQYQPRGFLVRTSDY